MRWAFASELTSPALLAGLAAWNASPHQAKAHALETVRGGLTKTTGDCLNVERIEMAVRLVFTDRDLTRCGLTEARKALRKAGAVDARRIPRDTPLSESAGLVFPVAQAGAFASLMSGMVIQGSAAVFLAAVLQYITSEILELAGKACKVLDTTAVQPRHIMLAIEGDEELDVVYSRQNVEPETRNLKINENEN
jgi:hypothetical protein